RRREQRPACRVLEDSRRQRRCDSRQRPRRVRAGGVGPHRARPARDLPSCAPRGAPRSVGRAEERIDRKSTMSGVFNDLKHSARMLLKNPGFTLVAVLSIAIGVGANAAMFSVADGLVLRPLQVPHPNDVLGINGIAPRTGDTFVANRLFSHPDYVDLRERAQSFTGVLAYNVVITSFAKQPNE